MSGRAKVGALALAVGLALGLSVSACDDSQHAAAQRHDVRPPGSPAACVDTSGLDSATDGPITAGPFEENRGLWTQSPSGTKLWVESSERHANTAIISAEPLSPGDASPPPPQHRRLAHHLISPDSGKVRPGAFFPGTYRLPSPGTWRLIVTIGKATGCFLVTVDESTGP